MPIFHFPFFYNPNFYQKKYRNYNVSTFTDGRFSCQNSHNTNTVSQEGIAPKSSNSNIPNSEADSKKEDYFFELFGLKLYFDDILLICLIFFLYEEGVKDEELFLSLILLLLS